MRALQPYFPPPLSVLVLGTTGIQILCWRITLAKVKVTHSNDTGQPGTKVSMCYQSTPAPPASTLLQSTDVMTPLPPVPDIVMTLDVDLVKDPLRRLQKVLLHLHGNIPGQQAHQQTLLRREGLKQKRRNRQDFKLGGHKFAAVYLYSCCCQKTHEAFALYLNIKMTLIMKLATTKTKP